MKRVLYITYDGLTDPLGQSQILPYLKGLSQYGYRFTILSFEKKHRFLKEKDAINQLANESGIEWVPLLFTANPPLISKFYDAVQMKRKAVALHRSKGFDMIHCRSYIAAEVGLYFKKRFGVKFFFDMRGFWADEKKDGGSWNMKHPIFKRVYGYYKKMEGKYLTNADYIISLTNAGKKELTTWPSYHEDTPVKVIPCCADMNLFSVTDNAQKEKARIKLNINLDELVLSYLGSIGTWYMVEEMLLFFQQVGQTYTQARFLFITHSEPSVIYAKAAELGINLEAIIVKGARRAEVPELIKASDINLSFIKPVYSKISSSPTKLGEVLSMGIPVICNSGVGDVEKIVTDSKSGLIIHQFSKEDFQQAINRMPELLKRNPQEIRRSIEDIYSLEKGIASYLQCYNEVFS